MTKKTFSKILKEMLIPNINKTAEAMSNSAGYKIEQELESLVYELKWDIYKEYQKNRNEFKENFMQGGTKSRINRHKIAALLYISFIYVMEENNFFNSKKDEKYLFVHNVIFNTVIGVIEAFIYFGEEIHGHSRNYISYVKKNGIVMQEYKQNSGYIPYGIKSIILAHKNNELSVLLLATIFHSIEFYSKAKFKESKKLKTKN